jgi:hypothetical protein
MKLKALLSLALVSAIAAVAGLANAATQRVFQWQQTHYIRQSLVWPVCPNNAVTCTINIGAVPYNTIILRVTASVNTTFATSTTDVVTLGTTQANANEIVSANVNVHTQGLVTGTVLATASSATGNGATQTGSNGGFDLWMKYTSTGSAPTAGNATLIVEYVPNNDGGCAQVPPSGTGSTPAGC